MTKNNDKIITEIIDAITVFGEVATDGECLDAVWAILTEHGYEQQLEKSRDEKAAEFMKPLASKENS